ncbi:MAG: hypothetical protein P8013_02200 [Candidatus Sulfobium sp.]
MKSGRTRRLFAFLILFTALPAAFLLLSGVKGEDTQKSPGARTGVPESSYTVTISKEAQEAGGITTEALKPRLHRMSVTAYGRVLDPEGINASRRAYVAATTGLERANAALNASEKEYERLKTLNASAKNVSDRALQAAAAQLAADRAEEANARGVLQSAKDSIAVKWGPTLSEWIFDYSSQLQDVLGTRKVLLQITVPPAFPVRGIAKRIRIEPPSGGTVSANFVSRATRTDPRIQGVSFIYAASSSSGNLLPGMNVTAQMHTGRVRKGFFVPLSAVVWLQDRAWVYVKKSATGFAREQVPTSNPLNEGYFVSGRFSPGDELVVKGAQALLSEESIPKATGGGEEEDED